MIEITETIARRVLEVVDAGLSNGLGTPRPGDMCVEAAVCYALGLPHGDDPACVAPALRRLKIRLNDSSWSSKTARAKGMRRLALVQLGSKDHLDEKEFVRRIVDIAIRKQVPIALRAAASIQKNEKHKAALAEAANRCEKDGTRAAAENARSVARAADAAAAAYADAYVYAYADAYADADAYVYAYADAAAYAAAAAYVYAYADADAYVYAYADAAAYAAAAAAADAYAAAYADRDKVLSDFAEEVVQVLIDLKAPGCEWLPLTDVLAA